MSLTKDFSAAAETKSADREHRRKLLFNIGKYNATVEKGVLQYNDLEHARKKAKNIKWRTIAHLDQFLVEFETRFQKNGGKVIWAEDVEQAQQAIHEIIKNKNAKSVVKAKSMATEEIELNEFLAHNKIAVHETDLGEYIQQLAGEKPYHIVTPAMHKSKEDVAKLFNEKLGSPINSTPQEMTMIARKNLREKYLTSEIGITGANFIIADIGGIAVTENEGNARLTMTFPKTHIVIVGIEKMIPSINHLGLFWPLLATFGTGQQVTVYNTIITGPRRENETDGPEEMYVILLDNGRTNLINQPEQRESLYCIRCGACLNACPVYKNIGGHSYATTYSGPIGSVITPHLRGMKDFKHLSFASSLCGNCTEVCPMHINLHNLLLYNRRDSVQQNLTTRSEKITYYFWKKGMLSRKLMNRASGGMKNFMVRTLFSNSWGKHRELPKFPKKSFNELWREKN